MTTPKTIEILSAIVEKYTSIPGHILFDSADCVELIICSHCLGQVLTKAFIEGLKYNPGIHSSRLTEISRN